MITFFFIRYDWSKVLSFFFMKGEQYFYLSLITIFNYSYKYYRVVFFRFINRKPKNFRLLLSHSVRCKFTPVLKNMYNVGNMQIWWFIFQFINVPTIMRDYKLWRKIVPFLVWHNMLHQHHFKKYTKAVQRHLVPLDFTRIRCKES